MKNTFLWLKMLRSALFRSLTIGSQGRLVSSSVSGEGKMKENDELIQVLFLHK